MSLRAAANRNTLKMGRPSILEAFRVDLTPRRRRDFDDVMADRTLSDVVVARALADEYDLAVSETTVRYWRQVKRLR